MENIDFIIAKYLGDKFLIPNENSWYYVYYGDGGETEEEAKKNAYVYNECLCEPWKGAKWCYAAPSYLEIWEWLWEEKNIFIKVIASNSQFHYQILEFDNEFNDWHSFGICSQTGFSSPSEAIKFAIHHLVENEMIK